MREDKFKPIKELFIDYLEQESAKINEDFSYARCHVEVHFPPNDDPHHGSFGLYLSCLLKNTEFEDSDLIDLGICAYDWNNTFTIDANICWGHPSGKIVAEVFDEPVEVNEAALAKIKESLPALISKLRQAIGNNPPESI